MSTQGIDRLVKQLSTLPGIGQRSAARLAFHILRKQPRYAHELANTITTVRDTLIECQQCFMLSDTSPCSICSSPKRDRSVIIVVAWPQDQLNVERTGRYQGLYHVLHGHLSPLEGIGPDDIRANQLIERIHRLEIVSELIIATSPNVDGDTTALYLQNILNSQVGKISRIASGIPIGGDLEYADGVTIGRALDLRRNM